MKIQNESDFQYINRLETRIFSSKKPKKDEMLEFIHRFKEHFKTNDLWQIMFNNLRTKRVYRDNLSVHLSMMMLMIDPDSDLNLSLKQKLAYVYLFS